MTNRPNIAVVVLDTLRFDLFEKHFDWLSGRKFKQAYSTSHWTVPAHGSLFTGQYPSEVGVHSLSQELDCPEATIAETLQQSGYTTRKYSANLNLHAWDGWDRGFTQNIGPNELRSYYESNTVDFSRITSNSDKTGIELYLSAMIECFKQDKSTIYSLFEGIRQVLQPGNGSSAKQILRELNKSSFGTGEFLFINIMDTHVPYYPPAEYRTLDTPVVTNNWEPFTDGVSNLSEIKTAYEDSVRYLSDIYRQIHERLLNEFDFIITLSDHGEMLGEHGMIDHSYGLYPQLIHIPLIISGSEIDENIVNDPVSILDVHATIADIADVEINSRGQSILDTTPGQDRLVEYQGLPLWLEEAFLDHGVSQVKYDQINKPLCGLITNSGTYAFETHDNGMIVDNVDETDPNDIESYVSRIHNINSNMRMREEYDTQDEVDQSVMRRLDKLGYA